MVSSSSNMQSTEGHCRSIQILLRDDCVVQRHTSQPQRLLEWTVVPVGILVLNKTFFLITLTREFTRVC